MTDTVHVEIADGIAEVTLDRPPANVLTTAMMVELADKLAGLADERAARVVLVRGAGKHFSAGVDVADHTADKVDAMLEAFHRAVLGLWSLPQPTIVAAGGACLGGGLELALAADLTCVASDARIGQPEVQVGVFPPVAAALLPAEVGTKTTLDLLLTGRQIDGDEALRLGVAQRSWPRESLQDEARALATQLASLSGPVLMLTKRAVRGAAREGSFVAGLERAEAIYRDELLVTHDAEEGLQAFLEKRAPVWSHR